METTPQQNFEYVPPKWNIDKLEGAVLHCLQVFGPLSGAAINDFSQRYAYERNKKLPDKYGTRSLLPRMLRTRKAFQISPKLYALHPLQTFDAKARQSLDAFWTFLENMEGVDMASVIKGPPPAQVSYIKNNRIYHIICCENDGLVEMATAVQLEYSMASALSKSKNVVQVEERNFIMFKSKQLLEKAPYNLHTKTLFGIVEYAENSDVPSILFTIPKA